VPLEGLGRLKTSSDFKENQTRDLQVCRIVPQSTALPRALIYIDTYELIFTARN
jgi:hypothetical protein